MSIDYVQYAVMDSRKNRTCFFLFFFVIAQGRNRKLISSCEPGLPGSKILRLSLGLVGRQLRCISDVSQWMLVEG